MRRRLRVLLVLLIILVLGTGLLGQGYVQWNERSSRNELARAGEIQFGTLNAQPPQTLLPRPTRNDNAAAHYLAALNAYNSRRRLPRDKGQAMVEEPPISDAELREIVLGSRCRECDYYAPGADGAPLTFLQSDGKRWPFEVASDAFDVRPYIPAFRKLAEVALREGKRLERRRAWKWAEAVYLAVLRMSFHLRQHPGSMMDLQLALEMERQAAHYLDVFYRLTGDRRRLQQCWQYGDTLAGLTAAVRRKYGQLGNFEAARAVALNDTDRMWRVEAIAAIKTAEADPTLDWWRRRRGQAVLDALSENPDADVSRAARRAATLGADLGPEERHEPLGSKHKEAPTQL